MGSGPELLMQSGATAKFTALNILLSLQLKLLLQLVCARSVYRLLALCYAWLHIRYAWLHICYAWPHIFC